MKGLINFISEEKEKGSLKKSIMAEHMINMILGSPI